MRFWRDNSKTNTPSMLIRLMLVLLTLITFTISSTPVDASSTHDMHGPNAAAMSQDMMYEHISEIAQPLVASLIVAKNAS